MSYAVPKRNLGSLKPMLLCLSFFSKLKCISILQKIFKIGNRRGKKNYTPISLMHLSTDGIPEYFPLSQHCSLILENYNQPQDTDPDLPGSAQESAAEACVMEAAAGWGTECSSAFVGPSEGDGHYRHYPHHSLASDQITGRKHSPAHQQKVGLKIY